MCGFQKQRKALTFYSQSLICHCNALVLLSFIILPYKTSAFPQLIFFCFYLEGRTISFLEEKKQKTQRGRKLTWEKPFSRVSCSKRKTGGSYVNRPFCAALWEKLRKNRRKTVPQMIFFCFFSSKKKRRGSRGSALYDGQLQRMSRAFV